MKLSFSLANAKAKAAPVGAAPPLKKASAFTAADDDALDAEDAAATVGTSKQASANKQLVAQNVGMSKTVKKRLAAEQAIDSSVFDYDDVYDKMQEAKERQKLAKEAESRERKPKYIEGLLTTAATRKLDRLRAEEKTFQREREAEGDEFAGKEEFVTQAYKDQMAEVRRAEEEEKRREEEMKKKKRGAAPTGLAALYHQMLNDSEAQHEETVAATMKPTAEPSQNLTITKPVEVPRSDADLAKAAAAEGKAVELNDDNQIVDKRELLSAGLNLSAPNTRNLALRKAAQQKQSAEQVQAHRAVGTAASRREINERRAREIKQQLAEEETRVAEQWEREERERTERTAAKRNQEHDVQSARERYLARKKRKLEDGEANQA